MDYRWVCRLSAVIAGELEVLKLARAFEQLTQVAEQHPKIAV